jgi:hypothetical protein
MCFLPSEILEKHRESLLDSQRHVDAPNLDGQTRVQQVLS